MAKDKHVKTKKRTMINKIKPKSGCNFNVFLSVFI